MRETKLYSNVDRLLPKIVHRQSMTGASLFYNGTPDRYYDGPKGDVWVEYKQLDRFPRSQTVSVMPVPGVKKQPKGRLSTLQLEWLERRWANSATRNAVVVVGLPNRKALLMTTPDEWRMEVHVDRAVLISEVARWICEFCGA